MKVKPKEKKPDLKQLLRKYMHHVYLREGVDFTHSDYRSLSEDNGVKFTELEWKELNQVSEAIRNEERARWAGA